MLYMRKLIPILFLLGCKTVVSPTTQSDCHNAMLQLQKLQCSDGAGGLLSGPNLNDQDFEERCVTAMSNQTQMNPACIATITTCDQADKCLLGHSDE